MELYKKYEISQYPYFFPTTQTLCTQEAAPTPLGKMHALLVLHDFGSRQYVIRPLENHSFCTATIVELADSLRHAASVQHANRFVVSMSIQSESFSQAFFGVKFVQSPTRQNSPEAQSVSLVQIPPPSSTRED